MIITYNEDIIMVKTNNINTLHITGLTNDFLDSLPDDSSVTQGDGVAYIDIQDCIDLENGVVEKLNNIGVEICDSTLIVCSK